MSAPDTQELWRQRGVQAPGYYLATGRAASWIDQSDFPQLYQRANPHAAIGPPDATINRNYLVHHADEGWPWRGSVLALHIVRFLSVFLGSVTLWATYRALALLIGAEWALLGTALFAFVPQFIFITRGQQRQRHQCPGRARAVAAGGPGDGFAALQSAHPAGPVNPESALELTQRRKGEKQSA